ncbi:hypothetical protein [Nisaea sediminum]|uniref:hypothetical protein n=1 Tax=Nisaea sediminum TaxID=2775867 RepID=UPI0018695845|nr:hypothetical protein [Nisaea sediminum]
MNTQDRSSGGQRLCFIVTSHDPLSYELRDSLVEPAIHDTGLLVIRSDSIEYGDRLSSAIWSAIERSAVMLAVVTTQSPHVYYELGIAHGIGVPTLVLVREGLELPVDTSGFEILIFGENGPDRAIVAAKLDEMLAAKAVA